LFVILEAVAFLGVLGCNNRTQTYRVITILADATRRIKKFHWIVQAVCEYKTWFLRPFGVLPQLLR